MATRSKRLFSSSRASGNFTDPEYTAPAGETVLVKSVVLYATAAGTNGQVFLRPGGAGGPYIAIASGVPGGANELRIDLWVVLQPGDTLGTLTTGAAGTVRYYVSGAELEGVAD